jgi:hypothetical protein
MPYYISPIGNEQQLTITGAPLVGGKIYTYVGGSSTPAATYTDILGSTLQANPIILNSYGVSASPIWLLGGQTIKFVITNSADVTQQIIDYVSGVNDVTTSATQSEWVASGTTPTYISATSFSVAGDQRGAFQVGRRLLTTNTAGSRYSTILTSTFAAGVTTITVSNDSGTLDSGLSAVFYGLISAVNTSLPAISTSGAVTFGGPNITLTPGSGAATYAIRVAAGAEASFVYGTGAADRWRLTKNTTAESGANAGSDFSIGRYSDAGTLLSSPVFISRSSGAVTLASPTTVIPATAGAGALAVSSNGLAQYTYLQLNNNNSLRWQFVKDLNTESGSNAGSDFIFQAMSDTGTFVANVFTVIRSTGVMSLGATPAITDNSLKVATTAFANRAAFSGATWQDVTASRTKATNYTNSTGRAIVVAVTTYSIAAADRFSATVDSVVVISSSSSYAGSSQASSATFVVPPGGIYRIDNAIGNPTLGIWAELRT